MTDDPPSRRFETLALRPLGAIHTDLRAPEPAPGPPCDGTPLLDVRPCVEYAGARRDDQHAPR